MDKSDKEKNIGTFLNRLANFLENLDELAEKETKIRRSVEGGTSKIESEISVRSLKQSAEKAKEKRPERPPSDRKTQKKDKTKDVEERQPLIDIFDRDDYLLVVASIPEVDESDLDLTLKEDALIVSAKRKGKDLEREIPPPKEEDFSEILSASFKNGVLRIKLGKGSKTENKDEKTLHS